MTEPFEHTCKGCGLRVKVAIYPNNVVVTSVFDDLSNRWETLSTDLMRTRWGASRVFNKAKRYILQLQDECSPDPMED